MSLPSLRGGSADVRLLLVLVGVLLAYVFARMCVQLYRKLRPSAPPLFEMEACVLYDAQGAPTEKNTTPSERLGETPPLDRFAERYSPCHLAKSPTQGIDRPVREGGEGMCANYGTSPGRSPTLLPPWPTPGKELARVVMGMVKDADGLVRDVCPLRNAASPEARGASGDNTRTRVQINAIRELGFNLTASGQQRHKDLIGMACDAAVTTLRYLVMMALLEAGGEYDSQFTMQRGDTWIIPKMEREYPVPDNTAPVHVVEPCRAEPSRAVVSSRSRCRCGQREPCSSHSPRSKARQRCGSACGPPSGAPPRPRPTAGRTRGPSWCHSSEMCWQRGE